MNCFYKLLSVNVMISGSLLSQYHNPAVVNHTDLMFLNRNRTSAITIIFRVTVKHTMIYETSITSDDNSTLIIDHFLVFDFFDLAGFSDASFSSSPVGAS